MRFSVMLYARCLYCIDYSCICRGTEAHCLYLVQVMDRIVSGIPPEINLLIFSSCIRILFVSVLSKYWIKDVKTL